MAGIDSFTKFMLHGEGADGSQTILDSEIVPKTVTAVGTFQIDTAQFKFGAASLLCGDGVDDYGYIEDSTDLAFGTGNFTIDCWIKRAETGTAQHNIFGQGNSVLSGGYHYGRIASTTSTFIFAMNDDTYSPETLTGITDTNWHHIAVVRNGNNIAVSLDGVFGNNVDVTGITYTDSAARFAVGQLGEFVGGSSHNGWIDEFRISKGIARWTSNFTPPTAQYTQDAALDLLDSISSSDNKTSSRGVALNFLDSMSSTDSKTQRLAFGQTYLDSVSLTDLISMAKEYQKEFIDGTSLSDFFERVARLSQAFPDAITLQDIFNRVLVGSRTFLDTTVMSDDVYKDLTKSFRDEVLLNDAITLLKKLNKLFEDSVTLTDSVQKGLSKEFNDTITLIDILERVAVLSVSPKDTITLNEKDFTITYTDRDIIEISADPQIQAGTHGQFLSLQYVTDYPKLRWVDGRGLKLFKGKAFTMNSGSIINFIYDTANNVWQETSRMQDIYTLQGEG